mmetsp:Transcript_25387/g.29242  ORF Transcript_25387/g.29242 Transcript_25387/m.29242 type:complete len:418 (-) Transcript_25387:5-1258(-)
MEITSDLDGALLLQMPAYHVVNNAMGAYYENGCWKTDGLTQNINGTVTTSHLSTFGVLDSLIVPENVESPNTGSKEQEKDKPVQSQDPEEKTLGMDLLKNSFLYLLLVLDICLVITMFISNRKFLSNHPINKTKIVNKKEMGYQKTVNDPQAENKSVNNQVEDLQKKIKNDLVDESGFPMKLDITNSYDPKKKIVKYIGKDKDDGFTNLEKAGEKEHHSEIYNVVEGEVEELQSKSLSGLFSITLPMKHRVLSPFYINHPFLSRFSRFLILSTVTVISWILPTILIKNDSVGIAIAVGFFGGFLISRILTVILEVLFNKRNHKAMVITSQVITVVGLILMELFLIMLSNKLDSDKFIVLMIVCFLITFMDVVVYECLSHLAQVYLCKQIREEKQFFKKNRGFFKLFINPVVYDYVMS